MFDVGNNQNMKTFIE